MLNETKMVKNLTKEEIKTFHNLMQIEFDGVDWNQFVHDLREKQFVMILKSEECEIVGFSTLMEIDMFMGKEKIKILFSGDTTIKQEYRDSFGFGIELSKFFMRTISRYPSHKIYYALISKGWRTYRVLPFYFKEFFPCYNLEQYSHVTAVMNMFGYKKYPQNYDESSGLLLFEGETQRLKTESPDASVPPRSNPHVDYFFKRNPNYLKGNELVCLAEVAQSNFTQVVHRLYKMDKEKNKVL